VPGRGAEARVYGRNDDETWIETSGRVTRLLSDDEEDSRHQRFIVTLGSGQTLLIAHNLDLASRVPVALGDRVTFRGMYELNDLGGLVHWTHRDPLGFEDGGWIRHHRRLYGSGD
jgi:hypothetical protein